MKKIVAITLVFLLYFLTQSINRTHSAINSSQAHFGVSISTSAMSNDMTFAVITPTPSGKKNITHITKSDFLHIASGTWKHPANPTRENLFYKNDVFGGIFIDTLSGEKTYFCPALDSLWKIKYSTNSYFYGSIGWANGKYMPSPKQQEYLWETYGIYNLNTDFFADTSFWKILRDVTNPEWITHYSSL